MPASAAERVSESRSRGRAVRWLGLLGVLALASGMGWWAARATIAEAPSPVAQTPTVVSGTVQEVSVGHALRLNVTVTSPYSLAGTNVLAGIVTFVADAPMYDVGDQVYAVAGQPVRVVAGAVPFYRDLTPGVSGPDVTQLQVALQQLGYLSEEPDGRFGARTATAVRAWQKVSGEEQTGTVALGRLIAVGALPGPLRLGESIVAARQLSGGEDAVFEPVGSPAFDLVVDERQADLIPFDATVTVDAGTTQWPAALGGITAAESGQVRIALVAPDGGPLCGDQCALVPPGEAVTLPAVIQIVPVTSGPGVPTAAVRNDDTGRAYVLMGDGEHRPVTVLASGDGLAVVDGLEVGEAYVVIGNAGSGP